MLGLQVIENGNGPPFLISLFSLGLERQATGPWARTSPLVGRDQDARIIIRSPCVTYSHIFGHHVHRHVISQPRPSAFRRYPSPANQNAHVTGKAGTEARVYPPGYRFRVAYMYAHALALSAHARNRTRGSY